jgi:hypothetical protein
MFRGTFATQRAGGAVANALDLHVKNTSNTNVVCWGGRLLTLFEAGQPYRLDPHTLETRGLETLGGRLAPGLPLDMGFAAANAAFSGMVRSTHEKLGNASFMPPELFNAGAGTGLGEACTSQYWGWHCCKKERLILRCICRQPAVPGACRGRGDDCTPSRGQQHGAADQLQLQSGPQHSHAVPGHNPDFLRVHSRSALVYILTSSHASGLSACCGHPAAGWRLCCCPCCRCRL